MKTIRLPSAVRGPFNIGVKLGGASALILVLSVLRGFAGANPPPFIDLGTLGGSGSEAIAINRAGQAVGSAQLLDGSIHPFIWDAVNGMVDLGGGTWGNAAAINNLGQVTGSTVTGQIQVQLPNPGGTLNNGGGQDGPPPPPPTVTVDVIQPFIWDAVNGMRTLETPAGAINSFASGINDNGQVVGQVQVAGDITSSGIANGEWHAVLWDPANGMQMQDLGTLGGGSSGAYGINAAGQVIGDSNMTGSQGFQGLTHSFIWDAINGMRDLNVLAGDETFQGDALNNAGSVAGTISTAQGEYRLAVWDSVKGLRDLGSLGAAYAQVGSINSVGEIVGSWGDSSAFLFDNVHGIQDLALGSASSASINDAGQIVGSFQSAAGLDFHAFLLNPPPPAIASLSPSTSIAGSAGITLLVNGIGFRTASTVFWNGSERPTTMVNAGQLAVQISSADLVGGADIVTVLVSVQNPNGAFSNPGTFTVTPANVAAVQSSAVDPGAVTTVSTAPKATGQAGVTATLQDTGSGPVTVAVASYSSDPSGAAFNAGGGFTDLQISGADSSMTATANFYYPSTVDAATEAGLTLMYFNGSAWVPVLSDNGTAPVKDTTDNLDGTISGGRFTVVFSSTSTPQITALQGTLFAAAQSVAFTGFLSPIGGADATGGTFANPLRTFKLGSTIPVKFSGSQYGAPLVTGIHTLQVIKYSNSTTSDTPIDATPQGAATAGNQFLLTDGQWIFNLDTKGTGMSVGIWQLTAKLCDGSTHIAWIQLK